MGLIIQENNKEIEEFSEIQISEADNLISLQNHLGEVILQVKLFFPLKNIQERFKNPNDNIEEVLIFTNRYYQQMDIVEVKSSETKKRRGILFNFSILEEEEAQEAIASDPILQVCILRSIFKLLKNESSCRARKVELTRDYDLKLNDFYTNNFIIGVFPHEWESKLTNGDISSLLYNLNRFGFYYINDHKKLHLTANKNKYHELNYTNISRASSKGKKKISYSTLIEDIISEVYMSFYIQELLKPSSDPISTFHFNYQNVEILSDIVLKKELNKKICSNPDKDSFTGYKLKKITDAVSTEKYRIKIFFNSYSNCDVKNNETIQNELLGFLNENIANFDDGNLNSFGLILYELRNQLVHNLQFVYSGSKEEISQKLSNLSALNTLIEYSIIDAITKINIID